MSAPVRRRPAGARRLEIDKVKGSRFIGWVDPIETVEAAQARIEAIGQLHPDASHHCWAWRLDGKRFRFSDDGEPSGTAGRPILQQIDGRKLDGALVVVSRWFGGTKLGAGGLVRAYGDCAAAALDAAGVEERFITERLRLRFGYDDAGAVQSVLHRFELIAQEARFGEQVEESVDVLPSRREALIEALRDRTAGRIAID